VGVAGCALNPATCAATAVGEGIVHSLFATLVSWVAASMDWVYGQLAGFLARTSDPATIGSVALPEFRRLLLVAPVVATCAALVTVLSALRRGDGEMMVREVALAAPIIVIGIGAAPALATLALRAVDELCAVAAPGAASVVGAIATRVDEVPSGVPGFGLLVLDGAGVLGAVLLWFELVVRDAVLALLLALSPVAFAAALWRPARRLAWRLVETFLAAALAKFVVVVALSMGAMALAHGTGFVVVTGVAVVLLAALAPFAVLRLVPLLELSAIHAVAGLRQAATGAARHGARVAASAAGGFPVPDPAPEPPREDLGLEEWPASPEPTMPDRVGEAPEAPVGQPALRTGHAVLRRDEMGPVLGWHFDE
jgi:hypothetical protein